MKYLFASLLLLLTFGQANAATHLLIKFSFNDCVVCNSILYSVPSVLSQTPVEVCMKERDAFDPNFKEIKSFLDQKGIPYFISDSLYYSHDSSERSIIYAMDGSVTVNRVFLKNADLKSLFVPVKGNIDFPELTNIIVTPNLLYLAATQEPYLLSVSKNDLLHINDTLPLFTDGLRQRIFKKLYPADFLKRMEEIDTFNNHRLINREASIGDLSADNAGNVYVLLNFQIINSKKHRSNGRLELDVRFAQVVEVINSANEIKVILVKGGVPLAENGDTTGGDYFVRSILPLTNKCAAMVDCSSPSYTTPIITSAVIGNDSLLTLKKAYSYTIDSGFIASRINTSMMRSMYAQPYFAEAYSKKVMNLEIGESFQIPAGSQNHFTYEQFSNLRVAPSYQIVSMYNSNSQLHIIAQDSNRLIHYQYSNIAGNPALVKRQQIANSFPTSDRNLSLTCSGSGMYMYNPEESRIEFISY